MPASDFKPGDALVLKGRVWDVPEEGRVQFQVSDVAFSISEDDIERDGSSGSLPGTVTEVKDTEIETLVNVAVGTVTFSIPLAAAEQARVKPKPDGAGTPAKPGGSRKALQAKAKSKKEAK